MTDGRKDLEAEIKKMESKYCPVRNNNCTRECVSFFRGQCDNIAEMGRDEQWMMIYKPRCFCALVTGEVKHRNAR